MHLKVFQNSNKIRFIEHDFTPKTENMEQGHNQRKCA